MALTTFGPPGSEAEGAVEALREDASRGREEARRLGGEALSIVEELRELARREGELARAEVQDTASAGMRAGVMAAVGGAFALLTLAFLATAAMFALERVLDPWLAALAVAGGLLVLTVLVGLAARSTLQQVSMPGAATATEVRRDIDWLRELITQRNGSTSSGD
ncbi:MAG: phage holin family protein [Dehalococcoidia bacterium]